MKYLYLAAVVCIFGFSSAEILNGRWDACDDMDASVVANVSVSPCISKMVQGSDGKMVPGPCQLKMGESYTIGYDFYAPKDAEKMKAWVGAKMYGLEMPWIGFSDVDACDKEQGGLKCPMKEGDLQHYRYSMSVRGYPLLQVAVVWRLYSGDSYYPADMCTQFQLELVDQYVTDKEVSSV